MNDIDKKLFKLAASKKDENAKIQQLINEGADFKLKDINGYTPFEVALNVQNADNAFLLLQNMLASQIDLQQLYKGKNILNQIIIISSFLPNNDHNIDKFNNIIDKLLRNNIDVNLPDRNSNSSLSLAMTCNNSDLAVKLIKYGALDESAINKTNNKYCKRTYEIAKKTVNNMFEAAKSGDIEDIKSLHNEYSIPFTIKDKDGKSLLEHALKKHHFKLAKLLSPHYKFQDLDFMTQDRPENTLFAQEILRQRQEYSIIRPRKRRIDSISNSQFEELDDLSFLAMRPSKGSKYFMLQHLSLESPCDKSGSDLSFLAELPPAGKSIGF